MVFRLQVHTRPRGFDILPDATHGSSGFLTKKEMGEFLELGGVAEVQGIMLGKHKARENAPDKYAVYAAHRMIPGDNNNLLCIGAPGSGKSRSFIMNCQIVVQSLSQWQEKYPGKQYLMKRI